MTLFHAKLYTLKERKQKMVWGAIASVVAPSLVSAGLDMISANSQNAKAKRAADAAWSRQQSWDEYKLRNAHQIETQDLKDAGINPAYTALTGGATSGTLSASPASVSGYGQIGTEALNNMTNIASVLQRQQEVDSQIDLNTSQIGINNANQRRIEQQTNLYPEQVKEGLKETRSRTAQNVANAEESKSRAALNTAELQLAGQEKILNDIDIAIKQIEREVKTGNFGLAMAYARETFETIKQGGQAVSSAVQPWALITGAKNIGQLKGALNEFKNSTVGKMIRNYKPSRY